MHSAARVSPRLSSLLAFATVLTAAGAQAGAQCWDWDQTLPLNPPYSRSRIVHDQARHAVFALSPGATGIQVYRLNSDDWTIVGTGPMPLPRYKYAACYHAALQKTLLFGGHIGPNPATATATNDLWEWDGAIWAQVPQSEPWPALCKVATMAYDPNRGRAIVLRYNTIDTWQTWEWTGTAWEKGPDLGPVGDPEELAFCFDAHENVGFVYTKSAASQNAEVYYYFTGPTAAQGEWVHVPGFAPPSTAYEEVTLVYDPHRRRIIRHGGRLVGTPSTYDDNTYAWNPIAMGWSAPIATNNFEFHGAGGCFDTDADRVVMFGGAFGSALRTDVRYFNTAAPGLSVDLPSTAAWCAGSNHVLAITPVGTMASNVQWFKDGNGIGGNSTILFVNSAGAQHAGLYECRVSNSCGEIWSRQCNVTVSTPTSIQQPFFYYASVCPGGTMAFVHPPPPPGSLATLTLQRKVGEFWEIVPVPYNTIEQAFIVPNPQNSDTGWYRLAIGNGCGTVVSDPVHVQVGVTFAAPPQSLSLAACQSAQFAAQAAGVGPLTFQWHKNGQPITDGDHISGATTGTLSIAGARYDDEGSYHCVVTDTCETRQTTAATLSIPAPPPWVHKTTSGPAYRLKHECDIAYDPVRGVTVLYGGYGYNGYLDDTWEWDGIEWTQKFPPNNPGKRSGQELVFDPGRGAILLFGGSGNVPPNSEVWSWDGTNWTLVTSSPNGPPVNEPSHGDAAFDAARGKMVLLCQGQPNPTFPTNVTWEFDSAAVTWQQVAEGIGPGQAHSPISFAPNLGTTMGQAYSLTHAPSNASSWWQVPAGWNGEISDRTPARYWPTMAYDALRKRTTTYGCCRDLGPGVYRTDTWAYATSMPWTQVLPDFHTTQTDAIVPLGMAFDTKRRAMVLVGGSYDDYWAGVPLQTWEYRYLDKVVIDRQPQDQPLVVGQSASFTVHAAGAGALTYEWRRNNTPLVNGPTPGGSMISGATAATLTITGVTPANAGSYTAYVANACGSLLSAPAMLGSVCYPDCNTSGTLTIADFGCFQTAFVAADPYADCNGNGTLTIADFACFQSKFVAGCP